MPQDLGAGTPKHVAATAFTAITTAAARTIGILFTGTGTCAIDGIYDCKSTASCTAATKVSSKIIANLTVTGVTANPQCL